MEVKDRLQSDAHSLEVTAMWLRGLDKMLREQQADPSISLLLLGAIVRVESAKAAMDVLMESWNVEM